MDQRCMLAHARPSCVELDPVGGVSGDMFVAAMLHGWPSLVEPVVGTIRASPPPRKHHHRI